MDLEISIPSDDPVRLVSAFVEKWTFLNCIKLTAGSEKIRHAASDAETLIYAVIILLKQGYPKGMQTGYQLYVPPEGMPAPDMQRSRVYLPAFFGCAKVLLAQMSDLLYLFGEISGKTIFIDAPRLIGSQ
ncbi:MAG: hypothetical protein V8S93_00950 [Lachnospiraceae bacterium]